MMVPHRLTTFLDENAVKYVVIRHSQAFTAREVASSAHIPKREIAKTVVVKVNGMPMMAVLPASEMMDLAQLRSILQTDTVALATEREFNDLFPDCEIGAMPPFGNLFGLDVIVSESLKEEEEIAFNAGTHKELIRMAYADFDKLVKPRSGKFTVERRVRADVFERGIS